TPLAAALYTGAVEVASDAVTGVFELPVSGRGIVVADRFVWTNSPSPQEPYTNWATAAHTLQEALDAAGEGDTVWVTNGVYDRGGLVMADQTNRAVVGTGVVLRSVNGPEVTHIVGARDEAATNGFGPASVRGVVLYTNAALHGFTVRGGYSASYGGGVLCGDRDGVISNCLITGNAAYGGGGGVAGADCYQSVIESNEARYGGGVFSTYAWDSVIRNNTAMIGGGGAMLLGDRCRITGNRAWAGGGVYEVFLTNCVVNLNEATVFGGGVAVGELEDCTVAGNRAPQMGGVMEAWLFNSVVYGNEADEYPNWDSSGESDTVFEFCCTTPLPEGSFGSNNIALPPRLVSMADPHLLADSPCMNAGTNRDWMASATDIDGDLRLNGVVDMGADEFWANSLTDTLQVAISLPLGPLVSVGYALPMQAAITGRCAQTRWIISDGTVITNDPLPIHSFAVTGLYEVTLSASNLLGETLAVVTVEVSDVAFYVSTNGSDAADGLTWGTAKQTIQSAVDACVIPGGTVWVSNGVYAAGGVLLGGHSNRVAVTNPITVRSVNGPEQTEIHGARDEGSTNRYGCGSNAVRGVYLGDGAVLSGFTVAAGRSGESETNRYGGGVFCRSTEALISNCVVVGNAALRDGGGVWKGTVTHSDVEYNEAASYGGGTYQSVVRHSRIIGNRAETGGGMAQGEAQNCLLVDNEATQAGGGSSHSDLESCTVIANSAVEAGGADDGTLVNTILYYNDALRGPNWMASGLVDAPYFSYCCTTPLPEGGAGNFSAEPQLAGLRQGHLLETSPCIGAGITQVWMDASTDCDGEPRVDGTSVDVGWDQFWPDACTNELEMTIGFAHGQRVAPGAALPMFADDDAGRPLQTVWIFDGEEVVVSNATRTSHAWGHEGIYTVGLRAVNDGFVTVAMATVYVENVVQHVAPSGNDGASGLNWALPKRTIQSAVDASVYGGLVLVSNGVYDTGARRWGGDITVSNRVLLTNAVTLRSVNGPEVTVIAGAPGPATNDPAAVRCVLLTPGTQLEGFSLTNGYTGRLYARDYGGGAFCVDETAVLSNCLITGCSAWMGGGGVFQGTIRNCRIESCVADAGGGVYDARVFDSIIRSNHARSGYGGGVYGGTAQNGLITANTAAALGGGAYAAELRNCTVTGNEGGMRSGFALNCIVYDNTDYNWSSSDSSTYRFTCTTPLPDGAGCTTNDPQLTAEYRLGASSPCVNAGSNEAWMTEADDLAGAPRLIGGTVDMGAYEALLAPGALAVSREGRMIRLGWSLPGGEQGVEIYRAATSGGAGVLVAATGPGVTNWTDHTLTNSQTFYYTLRALYNVGESGYSAQRDVLMPAAELDFDGDGVADIAVFWPKAGTWYILESGSGNGWTESWGWDAALPAPGDYDGDGKCDIAVYHPPSGMWYILESGTGRGRTQSWGWSEAVSVPGDYDGDGKCDMAVHHPPDGMWYILESGTGRGRGQPWGWSGACPVPGDYDGDGRCDMAVHHPPDGMWYILESASQRVRRQAWGCSGACPMPGDYDGDGLADVAVYVPDSGTWSVLYSSTGGVLTQNWGWAEGRGVPADYDGDGRWDVTVYAGVAGQWSVWQSASQSGRVQSWGWVETEPLK
ncbi:MAG: VCBS repeat-containing protein, partial [Kiritimatiellae bacterium]|nr:VCBS repeat-containing protein [Kiritimatiellia bacterium]